MSAISFYHTCPLHNRVCNSAHGSWSMTHFTIKVNMCPQKKKKKSPNVSPVEVSLNMTSFLKTNSQGWKESMGMWSESNTYRGSPVLGRPASFTGIEVDGVETRRAAVHLCFHLLWPSDVLWNQQGNIICMCRKEMCWRYSPFYIPAGCWDWRRMDFMFLKGELM